MRFRWYCPPEQVGDEVLLWLLEHNALVDVGEEGSDLARRHAVARERRCAAMLGDSEAVIWFPNRRITERFARQFTHGEFEILPWTPNRRVQKAAKVLCLLFFGVLFFAAVTSEIARWAAPLSAADGATVRDWFWNHLEWSLLIAAATVLIAVMCTQIIAYVAQRSGQKLMASKRRKAAAALNI